MADSNKGGDSCTNGPILAQALAFVSYLLTISAFPIWGVPEYSWLCMDLTLSSVNASAIGNETNIDFGDVTECFALEVIQRQLDPRQTNEDWMNHSEAATAFGILAVLFGFVAMAFLFAAVCSPMTLARLQMVLLFLICAIFCQIMTMLLFATDICSAYLTDIECTRNDSSLEAGGIVGVFAFFSYLATFGATCFYYQMLWNVPPEPPAKKRPAGSRSVPAGGDQGTTPVAGDKNGSDEESGDANLRSAAQLETIDSESESESDSGSGSGSEASSKSDSKSNDSDSDSDSDSGSKSDSDSNSESGSSATDSKSQSDSDSDSDDSDDTSDSEDSDNTSDSSDNSGSSSSNSSSSGSEKK